MGDGGDGNRTCNTYLVILFTCSIDFYASQLAIIIIIIDGNECTEINEIQKRNMIDADNPNVIIILR